MSLTRIATVVALAGAVSLTSGCGGSKVDPGSGALGSTVVPTPTTTAPAPTPTPTASSTPTPTRTTSAPADGGDGDAESSSAPATKGGGVCRYVGADEVGAVLGVAVSGTAVPGETGCKFDQAGKRGTSVTILDKSVSAAGGMDGAKTEANSAVEGTPEDLTGIGTAAFVVTGAMFGGPDVNAAGAVRIGSRIVSVYLVQRSGLDAAKVRALEIDLLKLVVKEAP